ncbi:MAG: hypothetical protein KDD53_03055, partial [Bdellovibrionales bacterium]|nr:hypothetical protein [Bdellovibrionales bacterium]
FKKTMVFPVSEQVVSLEFSYFDARTEEWDSNWGESPRVKLPSKVLMRLRLRSQSGFEESFTTMLALRSIN